MKLLTKNRRGAAAIAVAGTAALLLAGCSHSASSTTTSAGASSGTAAGKGGGPSIVIIGGAASDPFWSTVKRGAQAAEKAVDAAGGKVTYLAMPNYNNFGPDVAKLVQTAGSLKPDAVIAPDWVPTSEDAGLKQIVSQGTKLFIYNAGGKAEADKVGALRYIGSDDYLAAVAGGETFATNGSKNILCVNAQPGVQNEETRCKGIADGAAKHGAKAKELALPATDEGNQSAFSQAVKAALLKDSTVDGVVTTGTSDADAAADGIKQASASSKVKLGTFDVSTNALDRIKAGTELFALDQLPFAQGYYAISEAWQYDQYGVILPANPLLTGPLVITKANVAAAEAGTKLGVR